MEKLKSSAAFLISNFGPLIVFVLVNRLYGLKPAIALSLAYAIAEIVVNRVRGRPITPFFVFSAVSTIAFGVLDLALPSAFLFNYEASITNVITGAFFLLGAFAEKPLIQEFAEKRGGIPSPAPAELTRYFRIFTAVWAVYFFAKAGFYAWVATRGYSVERALAIRSAVGGGSFYALLAVSIFGGRRVYLLFRRLGWLSPASSGLTPGT